MSKTKKSLVLSCLSMLLCLTMLIGSTFAWFTDNASTGVNTIQAGTLKIDIIDSDGNSLRGEPLQWVKAAGHEDEAVLWEPNCTYELQSFEIVNNGNLAAQCKLQINGIDGNAELLKVLEFTYTLTNELYPNGVAITPSEDIIKLAAGEKSGKITVSVHMDENAGNDYQGLSINGIGVTVYATQDDVEYDSFGNRYDAEAEYLIPDKWDGETVDTDWYNEADTTFVISSVEEMLGFASLVDNQNVTFEGKVVELASDLDMTGVKWKPIGHYLNVSNGPKFQGTFDGKNHTISNLVTSTEYGGNATEGSGLFGAVADGCVIKNLKMTNVTSFSAYGYASALIGSVFGGNVAVDNVSIDGAKIVAARHVGGFIGITGRTHCEYDCTVTMTNCSMKNIEMVYVHANGTSNVVGTEGSTATGASTLVGIDSVAEENVTVRSDRDAYYAVYNVMK